MGKFLFLELRRKGMELSDGLLITLQVQEDGSSGYGKTLGTLSCPAMLLRNYRQWRETYAKLDIALRGRFSDIEPLLNDGAEDIQKASKVLVQSLNDWLDTSDRGFLPVRDKLIALAHSASHEEEVRLVIQSEVEELYRLPWHLWQPFENACGIEIAVSPMTSEFGKTRLSAPQREKVRILAILGSKQGIKLRDKAILKKIPEDQAEVVFLFQPTARRLFQALRDEKGWDLFFFAGHSATVEEKGVIHINKAEKLTISDLRNALRSCVDRGLRLAIFNSCDGLGLAWDLAELNIPHCIVMKEPIPDRAAYQFFEYFLESFVGIGKESTSLYGAIRQSRDKLQDFELEYPCVSWLPVICHNPAEPPLSWQMLRNVNSSPQAKTNSNSTHTSGVSTDGNKYIQSPCPITAIRFIPFYLGSVSFSQQKDDYLGFSSCLFEHVRIIPFDDGMNILILEEALQSKDIVDFLRQRRKSHLSFLSQNNEILDELREIQEITPSNPLIFELPNLFPYVMSIHHLENVYVSRKNVQYMTEPAILGITDDPLASSTFLALQENSFIPDESKVNSIHELTTGHTDYYISWSNVVATFSSKSQSQMDLNRLICYEILLQKLWYKLFLYAENMSLIDRYLDCLDERQLKLMKQEVFRTKMEYAAFIRTDARASSCMNDLKQKLILTSKISELFQNFSDQSNLLNDLEQSL